MKMGKSSIATKKNIKKIEGKEQIKKAVLRIKDTYTNKTEKKVLMLYKSII